MEAEKTAHNGTVYASPPVGGSGSGLHRATLINLTLISVALDSTSTNANLARLGGSCKRQNSNV
jgi:hypothetical protein